MTARINVPLELWNDITNELGLDHADCAAEECVVAEHVFERINSLADAYNSRSKVRHCCAKALAEKVPVITTRGAPWSHLEKHHCGWWIDVGTEPLVKARREAMALSDEERLAMGKRGRQLVQNDYTWPPIAERMRSVYEWILEGGAAPDCLLTN